MAAHSTRSGEAAALQADILDRALLDAYSMQDQELAAEIVELFLIQLPSMLEALDQARSPEDWAFATHTLKGSAAAVGALRLQQLAAELEAMPFHMGDAVRLLRIPAVQAAAADVRRVAREACAGGG